MASQFQTGNPPPSTQVPPPGSQSEPSTPEEQINSIHSHLVHQLTTLQETSLLRSESNTYYHDFLIPYLPPLLTSQRTEGIIKFRHAFSTMAWKLLERNDMDGRSKHFASALAWALDHAESALNYEGESAELRVMKALSTIFHLVTRFCHQEWDDVSHLANSIVDIPEGQCPSERDPLHVPHIFQDLKRSEEGGAEEAQDDVDETYPQGLPRSYSGLFPQMPHYIRRDGKHITPFACIRQGSGTCLIPFEFSLKERAINDERLDVPSKYLEISYRDNTLFELVPMQNVCVLHEKISRHIREDRNKCSKSTACVEVDGWVYDTMIEISKQAYMEKYRESEPNFITGVDQPLPKKRIHIRIPILPSCHVCVIDGHWFKECPIWTALAMCEHDLSGYAKFKVEFVEQIDATKIQISLSSMIVERDLLNYNDAIFELLKSQRCLQEHQEGC